MKINARMIELIANDKRIPGVIGTKSHHFLKPEDKGKVSSLDKVYLDVGAFSKDDVLSMGIKVGTPVIFKPDFLELSNNLICNKSMDNRALVAILINIGLNIKKERLKNDLYLVFSVQEEFNTRGILPTFRKILPDIAIGYDITPACDTPELKDYNGINVGGGVAITYMNHHSRGTLAGLAPNFKFTEFVSKVASENNINIQNEVATGILTETAYIVFENDNTVVANISIPTRYTHTNIEVLSLDDINSCYNLTEKLIYRLDGDSDFSKCNLMKGESI